MVSSNDIISVSLPQDLSEELDDCVEEESFDGRSQAIREGIMKVIRDSQDFSSLTGRCSVLATFTFGSKHGSHSHDVLNDYSSVVQTHLHHCTRGGTCLDILVLEGSADGIRACVRAIRQESKPESSSVRPL